MSKAKEKIVAIRELDERVDDYSSIAGFAVTTTKQTIKLYISNDSSCCESWGYFWCNDKPQDFVGAMLRSVSITDTALNTKMIEENGADSRDAGGIMFVNLDTSKGVLQFVAYNSHNGYYGHTAAVESEQLQHEECL